MAILANRIAALFKHFGNDLKFHEELEAEFPRAIRHNGSVEVSTFKETHQNTAKRVGWDQYTVGFYHPRTGFIDRLSFDKVYNSVLDYGRGGALRII